MNEADRPINQNSGYKIVPIGYMWFWTAAHDVTSNEEKIRKVRDAQKTRDKNNECQG